MSYLKELGVAESGLGQLIRATYHVLGLRTFFTFNEKEVRAWTIHAGDTAVKAAGTIHTDFERGFIKGGNSELGDLIKCGSVGHARETGHYRIEGVNISSRTATCCCSSSTCDFVRRVELRETLNKIRASWTPPSENYEAKNF